jgi:N-acetylmuramoyl-L-alanine amidase
VSAVPDLPAAVETAGTHDVASEPAATPTSGAALSAVNTPGAPGAPAPPAANSSGKYSVARQLGLGVSRVVIDAGHGGHDPGASAFGVSEAELVLDIALRLESLLRQQDVDVVLTRRSDTFVSLEERTEIANANRRPLPVDSCQYGRMRTHRIETYF